MCVCERERERERERVTNILRTLRTGTYGRAQRLPDVAHASTLRFPARDIIGKMASN